MNASKSTTLPPGPRWPMAVQTAMWMAQPQALLRWCAREYGDTFRLRLAGLGETAFISAPADIKQIFTADPEFLHPGESAALIRPLVGDSSLLILDGSMHIEHRRLLLPRLTGERLSGYASAMFEVARRTVTSWPMGVPFAPHERMQALTGDMVFRAVLGTGERVERLASLLSEMLAHTTSPLLVVPWILGVDFDMVPWLPAARLKKQLDEALRAEIARRRANPRDQADDVLSLLIDARTESGRAFSDTEIRDELITLLVAGHETTSTALVWALTVILREPAVKAALESELAEAGDRVMDPGTLLQLPYLDAVIKEALRLRPISPNVNRTIKQPLTIGGYRLPAGINVAPCIYLTHRRADIYPDPDRFLPERFLGKKPDPYAWLPFGGGTRRCIGMAFALTEMKIVLAMLLLHADIELTTHGSIPAVRRGVMLAPSRKARVQLSPRRAAAR